MRYNPITRPVLQVLALAAVLLDSSAVTNAANSTDILGQRCKNFIGLHQRRDLGYGVDVKSIGRLNYISGRIPDHTLQELTRSGHIDYIQDEVPISLCAAVPSGTAEENPLSWGLDRIDQKKLPLDKQYAVNVYVVDTGINVNNPDIKGRATWGAVFGPGKNDPPVDDFGHGTFVAGVIAGKQFGVAKKANLISVKVYRKKGDQTTEDVIKDSTGCLANTTAAQIRKLMSSGAPFNEVLNRAVEQLTAAGITVVTSAGNSGEQNVPFDSCNHSPSSSPSVISVGATDKNDKVASFSNTGKCVTLFAPGSDVVSISNNLGTDKVTNGGTSFSTPYVTGVVALLLGEKATKGVLQGIKSGDAAPNLMLYSRVVDFSIDSKQTSDGSVKESSSSGQSNS
ncbi:peptidase S8/S53 domain-containing protein [Syncephalis fuscata]|nr:peptidase S8/S53 domain-containing protein [Syncephalis fuscata]